MDKNEHRDAIQFIARRVLKGYSPTFIPMTDRTCISLELTGSVEHWLRPEQTAKSALDILELMSERMKEMTAVVDSRIKKLRGEDAREDT